MKDPNRVPKHFNAEKYPDEWVAQYDMLLDDGVTCKSCEHLNRCVSMFGSQETDTSCSFYPNRFKEIEA